MSTTATVQFIQREQLRAEAAIEPDPVHTSPAAKTFGDGRPACITTRAHSSTVTPR